MTREAGLVLTHQTRALAKRQAELEGELADLRAHQDESRQRLVGELDALGAQLTSQGKTARVADADAGAQMDRLTTDLNQLRGAVEVNAHQIGESEARVAAGLGERLDQLARQVAELRERPARQEAEAKLPRTPARALAAAQAKLKAGQGAGGRALLRALLKTWPAAPGVSDEALLQLGTSLADDVGCQPALRELIALVERFPKSPRLDAAYFRMGSCAQSLNRRQDAEAFFGELVARYPASPWRAKAEAQLAARKAPAKGPAPALAPAADANSR